MSEDAHDSNNFANFDALQKYARQVRADGILQEKRDGVKYAVRYQASQPVWVRRAVIGGRVYDQVITLIFVSGNSSAHRAERLEANAYMASDGAWGDAVPCWKQNFAPEFSALDCEIAQRAWGVILDESRLYLPKAMV